MVDKKVVRVEAQEGAIKTAAVTVYLIYSSYLSSETRIQHLRRVYLDNNDADGEDKKKKNTRATKFSRWFSYRATLL